MAVIADGSEHVEQRTLAEDAWVEIDAWAAASDAALPKRPAPLGVGVASVMLRQTGVPVIAERFASIPLEATSPSDRDLTCSVPDVRFGRSGPVESVTVEVRCDVALAGLALLPIGGTTTFHASATEVIDAHRGA